MIYRSKGCDSSTVHYIGNGRMIVCENGADIQSIRGSAYSSPIFGSLKIKDVMESETYREKDRLSYLHYICFERQESLALDAFDWDAEITDFIHPEKQVFCRYLCCRDECVMHLETPGYVKKFRYSESRKNKTPELFLYIIPSGTEYYEGLFCQKEIRMLIAALGEVECDGEYFKFGVGDSCLLIAAGDPEECAAGMKYALKCASRDCSAEDNEIYKASLEHFEKLAKNCPDEASETLFSLLARQSSDGGIMASDRQPLSDINCFYYAIRAFESLSLYENSERLVNYYINAVNKSENTYNTYNGLNTNAYIPDISGGGAAACLMLGLIAYYENHGMKREDDIFLRKLFYFLMSDMAIEKGVSSFTGREAEFDAGIIERLNILVSGSAEVSARVIAACRKYVELANEKKLKVRSLFGATVQRLEESAEKFRERFIFEGKLYSSCLMPNGKMKKQSFIYSRCPECEREGRSAPLTWLEKHSSGRYLCSFCILTADSLSPRIVNRSFQLSSVCVSLLCGLVFGKTEHDMLELVKARAEQYVKDISAIPMRCAREDMLVSTVLEKYGIESERYNEVLCDIADEAGCFSTYLCGEKGLGSLGDSYPTAMYLCRLLSFQQKKKE